MGKSSQAQRSENFLPTHVPKAFESETISKILRMGSKSELNPEEDWVRLPVEPIVSTEHWGECNRMIKEAADLYRQDKTNCGRAKHLFSGLIYYGSCGGNQKLYPLTNSTNYVCRECRQKMPKDDLDALFIPQATSFLVDESKVREALEKQQSEWKEAEHLLQASEKELKSVQGRIDLYSQGAIGVDEVKKQMRPLETQKEQLERTIPTLKKSAAKHRADTSKVEDVILDGQSIGEQWEGYDPPKRDL